MPTQSSIGNRVGFGQPEVSKEFLELLELRLSESISTRVKGSLFKLYGAIGVVVGGVLTYAGIDLFDRITDHADKQAQQLIAEKVTPTITDAADQAEKVTIQLGVIEELNKRAQSTMDKLNDQLQDFEPRAQQLQAIAAQLEELDARRKSVEENLAKVGRSVTSLGDLGNKLSDLAKQVTSLSEVVATLQPSQETSRNITQIMNAAQGLVTASQQVTEKVAETSYQPTVVVRYFGIPPKSAQELVQLLRDFGFQVPEEQEVLAGTGRVSQIRYFWPQDEGLAEDLRSVLYKALFAVGNYEEPPPIVRGVDGNVERPHVGTVELWIGPPSER